VRGLMVISIQNIIYSGFIVVEMLSHHDRVYAKILLFIVFFYLAFFTANAYGYRSLGAIKLTLCTSAAFFLLQQTFWWVLEFTV
jgi:hypothetical protein